MAKTNVNAASREELIEVAGLRPELADAIVKLRGKHGSITSVDALEEVPGIGPATLEQLRKSLEFRAKNGNESDEGERNVKEAAEKTTNVAISAARGGAEAARGAAEAGAEAASSSTREGLQVIQRMAGAVSEVQRETARQSAEGTAELGKLWVELLNEQNRHNLAVATALSKAVDWEEVVRVQSDYMRGAIERMNQLNSRYLEIVRAVMSTSASATQDQDKKAA